MAKATPSAEPGIDMGALFKKIEFEPHSDAQWEYCRSKVRFNIPCCGRRWGKSQAAGHRMTHKLFIPDSYNWIVGPTYKLGEKEFRVVWHDFRKLDLLKYCKKSYSAKQGDMRIETPWGAVLEVVSADKQDSLLGEGLSHAIMSEAARHHRSTWEQFIEPALSDLLGTCDFPSTPKGFNWYHGLWELGQAGVDNTGNTYQSWQFPSWTNPIRYPGGIDNDEIQRIQGIVSKIWFDQEYGASFTALTGAIYEEWNEKIHVKSHEFNPAWPNFLAFDYGFANPFVCLDIQVTPSDDVIVWREYYQSYKTNYEHANILKERNNPPGYRIDGAWGDLRDPDAALTLSTVMQTYVGAMDVPWGKGVEEIKRQLRVPRLFISPNCPNLIRQMGQLHIRDIQNARQDLNETTGDRNIQHKVDDHACDALRYFIGPYFVMGANSHLEDIYGKSYTGSESHEFFTLNSGFTLDTKVTL